MADDSGRVVRLWGPLLLVAMLVAVFRFAATGETGSGHAEARRGVPSSPLPTAPSPGAAATAPMPGGETGPAGDGFVRHRGPVAAPYMAGPAPYPAMPGHPPWAVVPWPPPFPRPGDHSSRYWGSEAAEWGLPIGEYGPDTRIDPYWWVPVEDGDR